MRMIDFSRLMNEGDDGIKYSVTRKKTHISWLLFAHPSMLSTAFVDLVLIHGPFVSALLFYHQQANASYRVAYRKMSGTGFKTWLRDFLAWCYKGKGHVGLPEHCLNDFEERIKTLGCSSVCHREVAHKVTGHTLWDM